MVQQNTNQEAEVKEQVSSTIQAKKGRSSPEASAGSRLFQAVCVLPSFNNKATLCHRTELNNFVKKAEAGLRPPSCFLPFFGQFSSLL